MLNIEIGKFKRSIQTFSEQLPCGDEILVLENEDRVFLALFDGAGHGHKAAEIAKVAINYLRLYCDDDLCSLVLTLHDLLRGTIGGVISLCRIDKNSGELHHTGLGNVVTRLFLPHSFRLVHVDGVLGYQINRPKLHQLKLSAGNILMLYSDGIKDRFEVKDFNGFFDLSADNLARITIDNFSKNYDDAACIVVKVNND